MGGKRATGEHTLVDLFPFSILPPGALGSATTPRTYNDRAIAIITSTVVEQALESAILNAWPPLSVKGEQYLFTDPGAPLGSFDAKTRIAWAAGIIGQGARADLSAMRKIRNTFAHSRLEITFDSQEIWDACKLLRLPERIGFQPTPEFNAREWFIFCGHEFVISLVGGPEPKAGRSNEPNSARAFKRSFRAKVLDLPSPCSKSPRSPE